MIDICDNLEQKLTCGVVSNDVNFLNNVLGRTSNGTTYAGIRARTTGAPQNHWFGPGGDPRGGGIGSYESIQLVWSHHREIVYDYVIPNNLISGFKKTYKTLNDDQIKDAMIATFVIRHMSDILEYELMDLSNS